MSARISPPIDVVQGEDSDGNPAPINVSNRGELNVTNRDPDNEKIINLLQQILEQLAEINN